MSVEAAFGAVLLCAAVAVAVGAVVAWADKHLEDWAARRPPRDRRSR